MKNTSNSTSDQVFLYIEQMLIEMRIMSEKQNAPVLAYLIEMAIIEASDTMNTTQNPVASVDEEDSGVQQLLNS